MPGATVESFDGETINGRVKVKVGPIQVTYNGTARFIEKDEAARRAVIEASGKEARGVGHGHGDDHRRAAGRRRLATDVNVTTDLAITGKPAQFGRGVMVEVGNKLLGRFADCLADELGSGSGAAGPAESAAATEDAAAPADPTPAPSAVAGNGCGQGCRRRPRANGRARRPRGSADHRRQPRPHAVAARPTCDRRQRGDRPARRRRRRRSLKRVAPLVVVGLVVCSCSGACVRRR